LLGSRCEPNNITNWKTGTYVDPKIFVEIFGSVEK
jgi:hypothetical protein